MIHLGTDLVRVSRFESTTDHFLRRSFTEQEIRLSGGKAQSLAGRWAVKESVLKALGMGMALPFSDIEVRSDDDGTENPDTGRPTGHRRRRPCRCPVRRRPPVHDR